MEETPGSEELKSSEQKTQITDLQATIDQQIIKPTPEIIPGSMVDIETIKGDLPLDIANIGTAPTFYPAYFYNKWTKKSDGTSYTLWIYIKDAWKAIRLASVSLTDNGNSGASKTIDWRVSTKQKITTTASCTLTFTAPPFPTSLILKIIHEASATAYTYTWPGTVKWPSGTAPTLTNTSGAVDIIALFFDGTNYYSVANTNFS